jgi:hypothetical protein
MKANQHLHLLSLFGVSAGLALSPTLLRGADSGAKAPASDADVLLNIFQDKGLISPQDVEKARAELAKRAAKSSGEGAKDSKIKIAKWIESVDLFGDARLRYEYRGGEGGDKTGGDQMERNRWRYRLRAGARLQFTDHFQGGVRLESGPSGRSSNVTYGDDVGPWGKNTDGLFIGLLYFNYAPTTWFNATAGRQENPFKTTSLVWDHDLTPEGLSESFTHTVGKFDLFATFGQYIYDDSNPDNVFGAGADFSDAFLFVNQVGGRFNFNKDVSAQIAPALNFYSGQGDTYGGPFVGSTLLNTVGINDLLILDVPAEVKFKIGSVPARLFGDFAVNLEGSDRARAAGNPSEDDEIYAWQAGVEVGSAKKKSGWSGKAYYQSTGLYSLDANMVDSDLFDSRLNMNGFVLQGVYAFTDFLNVTLTYANADRKNNSLPTGGVGDLGLPSGTAELEKFQLLQADLNFKF